MTIARRVWGSCWWVWGAMAMVVPLSGHAAEARKLSLDQCIAMARENNVRAAIGRSELDMARALMQQAMSGYWFQLSADVKATRLDEDPVFDYPSTAFTVPSLAIPVPAMSVAVPSTTVTVPAQQLGPITVPPQNITSPAQSFAVPGRTLHTPAFRAAVPGQTVTVMDRDVAIASVRATLPLYTGGLRPALVDQARAGVSAAQEQIRRTDADLVYETAHFYHGAVAAGQLVATAKDTLERMEATQDLTEKMFNTGSGRVKKTDFLRSRSMVEIIRGSLAEAEARRRAACAALGLAIGATWSDPVEPADEVIAFDAGLPELGALVAAAQRSSPEVARAEAGVQAAEAKVREAKSGHYPKVGLQGLLSHIANDYDQGAVAEENVDSWMVGVGAELPLFEGFRTSGKVREASYGLSKMKQYRDLMGDVVALQVQLAWLDLEKATRQESSARAGLAAATENRELNVRAYQDELVETKDVIEAQIMEAVLKSQYFKVVFDHADAKGRLEQIAGRE